MILILDNYDSFTYNIYQTLSTMKDRVEVVRSDKITVRDMTELPLTHLVISPGPGRPEGAGVSLEAVSGLAGKVPILGVCLGHQSIGQAFGARVVQARQLMHGKGSRISHSGSGLFSGLDNPFEAIRYHSLSLERETLPEILEVTATADDGEIMGVRHRIYNVEGVQFHPESFGSPGGERIFQNFLKVNGGMRHAA